MFKYLILDILFHYLFNQIYILWKKNLIIIYLTELSETLRDLQNVTQMLNGHTKFLMLNEKKLRLIFLKITLCLRDKVLKDLQENKDSDYIAWIGHATFLIKLGNTTIITDPLFSKNTGPLIFGPKRYVDPAIKLDEVPKTDLLLLTHNHYDHLDASAIRNFPHKDAKVLLPLKLSKYFKRFKDVNELDWYDEIQVNKDIKVTLLPAVHWSKEVCGTQIKHFGETFLIEYKGKKILFASDTGYWKYL